MRSLTIAEWDDLIGRMTLDAGLIEDGEWWLPVSTQQDSAAKIIEAIGAEQVAVAICRKCGRSVGSATGRAPRVWMGTFPAVIRSPSFRRFRAHVLGRRPRQVPSRYAVLLDRSDTPTTLLVHCPRCGSGLVQTVQVSTGTLRVTLPA